MTEERRAAERQADAAHAARGGVVQLLGVIAQGLMPLCHVLITRLMGQATFGVYASSLAVNEILIRLGLGGGDKAMHRFIAAHRAAGEDEREHQALGTALRLSSAITLALAALVIVGAGPAAGWTHRPELGVTLPFMAPAIVATPVMLILVAATLGRRVTTVSFFVRGFAEPGFLIMAAVVAWTLGAGPRGLGVAHAAAAIAAAGAALLGARRVFGAGWVAAAMRGRRHPALIGFALPVAASEAANAVFQRTDMLVLSVFVPPQQSAAYFAAEFLGRVAANVRYAFDGIAAPVLSESLALHDRERLRYNLRLFSRWVATLSLPLASTMIALRVDFLRLYGPGYVAAATVAALHTTGHLLSGVLGLAGHVIMMSGRSRLVLANQVGAALLNLGLCLVLVPRFGIVGAAASVLASLVALVLAMLIEVKVLEDVHPFHGALARPFVAGAAGFGVQILVARSVAMAGLRIPLVILAGAVSYGLVLFALGLGKEERQALASLRARLTRRRA